MREDLAETEARIEVCTKFDCDDGHLTIIDELHSDDGSQQHMQRFLESQPDLPSTMIPLLTHGHSRTPHLLKSPPRDNLLRPPVLVPPSCLLRSTTPRLLNYLLRTSTPTHLISFPLPVVPNQTQWKTALQITAFRTIARPQLTLRQTQKVQPCSKQSPSCLRPKTRIDYPYPLQEFSTATH